MVLPRYHAPVVAAAALCALAIPAAHAATTFTSTLSGAQEVPVPGPAGASGSANFVLNDAGTALSFSTIVNGIDFTGSQTPGTTADNLTNAHIHAPGPPGVAGPVVWGFIGTPFNDTSPNDVVVTPFTSGVGGTVTGTWNAAEGNNTTLGAQVPALLAGNAYINFHTTGFPGGAVRGQIVVAAIPEPVTLALMGAGLLATGGMARRRRAQR